MTTTQYQYAVRSQRDNKYVAGSYSDFIAGHFHWHAHTPGVDGAYLFGSASEAERKTKEGREGTSYMDWVIVPVKVITTTVTPAPVLTYPDPIMKTVRELA